MFPHGDQAIQSASPYCSHFLPFFESQVSDGGVVCEVVNFGVLHAPSTSASHRLDQKSQSLPDKREQPSQRYRNPEFGLASASLHPVDPGSG